MRLLGHFIVRLVQVAAGFCLGLYFAAFVLALSIERWGQGSFPGGIEAGAVTAAASLVAALFLAVHLAPLVAGPAALAVVLAEAARLRGLVANLLLGGAVAALTGWFASGGALPNQAASVAVLAAGFAGGFVYWAVAGRSAGSWNGTDVERQG